MTLLPLAQQVEEVKDKIVDLVVGPVKGTIGAQAAPGFGRILVERGQTATLPDGRVVRVTEGKRVGEVLTPVTVRLMHLLPSALRAGNFASVPLGTVATWVSPPAGLLPTGTTSAFGFTTRAQPLGCSCFCEAVDLEGRDELFKVGVLGKVGLILHDPDVRNTTGANVQTIEQRILLRDATWKLSVSIATIAPTKERRVRARDLHDNLVAVLHGSAVGDSLLVVGPWRMSKREAGFDLWELHFVTQLYSEGRVMQPEAVEGLGTFTDLDGAIKLPEDALQPGPFRVQLVENTNNEFDEAFDDSFG